MSADTVASPAGRFLLPLLPAHYIHQPTIVETATRIFSTAPQSEVPLVRFLPCSLSMLRKTIDTIAIYVRSQPTFTQLVGCRRPRKAIHTGA